MDRSMSVQNAKVNYKIINYAFVVQAQIQDFSKGDSWYLGVAESISHDPEMLQFENWIFI